MKQTKLKGVICSVVAVIGLIAGSAVPLTSTQPVGQVTIDSIEQGTLTISPVGLAMIGDAEGCRQAPYSCPAGLITNGIGNTHGVPDAAISLEQVAKDFTTNIIEAERCLLRDIPPDNPLTQGQHDAFTSFVFNLGCQRYRHNRNGSETSIYKLIKQGDYHQACHQLPRWVYSGGERLTGLVTRRANEYALCVGSG